jgi:hypothetical protein
MAASKVAAIKTPQVDDKYYDPNDPEYDPRVDPDVGPYDPDNDYFPE